MTMRENDGFNAAKIDAQPRAVVFDCEFNGAGVEKDGMPFATTERSYDNR